MPDSGEKGLVEVISRKDSSRFLVEQIRSSINEILLLLPRPNIELSPELLSELHQAIDRGVSVKVLTHVSNGIPPRASIRKIPEGGQFQPPQILLVDGNVLAYEMKDGEDMITVHATSPSIIQPFATIFEFLWIHSVMYDKFNQNDKMKDAYIQQQRELYDKLRQADQMKVEFINIAAHELRTPIMPILGGLELIQSKIGTTDSTIKEELAIIGRNAERLLKLSEDILQASRIETGRLRLHIEAVNMNALVTEVIADVERKYSMTPKAASAESTDIHSLIMFIVGEKSTRSRKIISFDAGDHTVIVECDRGKLVQVLFNLLDNGMKYVDHAEGGINVSMRVSGCNAIITVRDNGQGIDPSIKDKMFEKFTTKSEKGSGLGLFIAKNIVEAHGGQIWAGNNSDGRGATFAFTLPLHFRKIDPYAETEPIPQMTSNQQAIRNLRTDATAKIDAMKVGLLESREVALRKRNNALKQYQKKVEESRNLIKARQEYINNQINYKRMRREVDSRIEKGLEGLSRLIDGLRENIIGEETIKKIELHPTVSNAIKYEAAKIIQSEFFISIKQQLEETTNDA